MVAVAFALLLLHYQTLEGSADPISCYDDLGKAVDWFYLYKLPHHKSRFEGLKYLFMNQGSEGWADGKGLVNDSAGALGRTVGPLYTSTEQGYILYNDQPPAPVPGIRTSENVGRSGGHTKGVVLFDKKQGYWLVHSTPHFPPPKKVGQFSYPDSGVLNGQNFICVTYPLDHFQTIGEQLQINQPHIFDCHIPDSLASSVQSMVQLCKDSQGERGNVSLLHDVTKISNRSVSLTSLGGTTFIDFAKGASFANDLYHSWVAPTLQSDLLVQFWQRSTGIQPSNCSGSWKVLNVQQLAPGQRFTFDATDDHSKWAVSTMAASGSAGGWVCVGDINRNEAEEKRGGGTVCLQDPTVWKAYRSTALKCLSCQGGQCDCDTATGR
ncbi:deoxyribonuclease-2-alpha-like [Alosa pseudoharengus]|uniref:deoxyribonuclease-2-alpha-like n=1 Tax=Alosa pseudoharengus TaxID=34774 RepID=UPI003F892D44